MFIMESDRNLFIPVIISEISDYSMDSNLEAFSDMPTGVEFTKLSFQSNVHISNLKQRFLSY